MGGRDFYPRPPGGGRPEYFRPPDVLYHISIHALRVEGDLMRLLDNQAMYHFYPRPPGGGRLSNMDKRRSPR